MVRSFAIVYTNQRQEWMARNGLRPHSLWYHPKGVGTFAMTQQFVCN